MNDFDAVPVIEREEPPLQADIMIRSSMTLSLILISLPQLCTMNTSCSRTEVSVAVSVGSSLLVVMWLLTDLHRSLAIVELLQRHICRFLAQALADSLHELGVRGPREHSAPSHLSSFLALRLDGSESGSQGSDRNVLVSQTRHDCELR